MDIVPFEYINKIRQEFPEMKLEVVDGLLENLRMMKSPSEIDILKKRQK